MFKRVQVSTTAIRIGLILSTHLSLGLDASDPCSGRKFCGNLTIIYNGAGENLPKSHDNPVDPSAYDTAQYLNATTSKTDKNTKVLLLSSDSSAGVSAAATAAKAKLGESFIHIPTSRPSFDQYLRNDTSLNALKKSFESDPLCKEYMRAALSAIPGGDASVDISKFIKVDVLVASHSARAPMGFAGLPVWPNDSDKGEDDRQQELFFKDYNSQHPKAHVRHSDFEQLRNAFSRAVFHNVSMTCDGVNVGEMIAPLESDSCACFTSYTARDTVAVRYSDTTHGALDSVFRTPKGQSWEGKASLTIFSDLQNNYNRWILMGSSTSGGSGDYNSSLFTVKTPNTNPFDMFALNSADVYAADIISKTSEPVSSEANIQFTNYTSDKHFNGALKEIELLVSKKREQHIKYVSALVRDPESLKNSRTAARDFYNNCIFEPQGDNISCKSFRAVIDEVNSKQAQDTDFVDAMATYNKLMEDFQELADSPILEGKESDPLKYLAVFREHAQNFADFRNSFTRAARKLGRSADIVAALKEMSTKWATYHSAYINAYFPDIVGDTLNRRVENIAKAAKLLKEKFIETADPRYKKKLERLRSQLACTLNFPIGPNYKDVNEYPSGSLIVDAEKAGSDLHTDPKAKPPAKEELPALR